MINVLPDKTTLGYIPKFSQNGHLYDIEEPRAKFVKFFAIIQKLDHIVQYVFEWFNYSKSVLLNVQYPDRNTKTSHLQTRRFANSTCFNHPNTRLVRNALCSFKLLV